MSRANKIITPIIKEAGQRLNKIDWVQMPFDDATNADVFHTAYSGFVKFVSGAWWVYSITDGKFIQDIDRSFVRCLAVFIGEARRTAIGLHTERLKEALRFAQYSLSAGGVRSMLELASSQPGFYFERNGFDKNPDIILDASGQCVDLRTGEARPATVDDYFTRALGAVYDPAAICPLWEKFLIQAFQDDLDSVFFLQRWIGYTFTGRTSEGKVLTSVGNGLNGKGVCSSVAEHVAGEYGRTISPSLFAPAHGASSPPYELAELPGVRSVYVRETPSDGEFDEGLFKSATGEDTLPARMPYQRPFTFRPIFKLSIETNHAPKVKSQNLAMWRRLMRLDWNFRPAVPDPDLREKLLGESSGILAWIIQGSINWYRFGLQPPESVKTATRQYREGQDILKDFLDGFALAPDASIASSDIYMQYRNWADGNGLKPMSAPRFKDSMKERGFESKHTMSGKRFIGLR